jgi:hypothetical protein
MLWAANPCNLNNHRDISAIPPNVMPQKLAVISLSRPWDHPISDTHIIYEMYTILYVQNINVGKIGARGDAVR